jgi:Mlc titration factor MtfA (ptsG expression regulator)
MTDKEPMIIKVGSQRYTVEERSKTDDGMLNDGSYGYTLDNGNLIVIDKDVAKGKKQITLLHEVLHAIRLNNDGLPKPRKKDDFEAWEHYFIGLYENNLLAVMKDNPHLVKWLTNEQ